MIVDIYNQKNNKVDTMELPDSIFKTKWNPRLVHQVMTVQLSNSRVPLAHTKNRAEVRGGGRKPWRQKHTGRSRHGSSRSPLWVGGGVTFGPRKDKKFERKINKKMKVAALFSVLSKKMADKEIKILESLELESKKTKNFTAILKNIFGKISPSALISVPRRNKNILFAGRNVPKIKIVNDSSLSIYDCLTHKYIIFDKESVLQLVGRYAKVK
jgi:large subunit ribosomal protein L4